MLFELVYWWYGAGWVEALQRTNRFIRSIWRMFSVAILLRTLFDPWRRITTPPGKGLDAMFRVMIDNFVSRCVGLFTRTIAIFTALIASVLAIIAGSIIAIGWLVLPISMIYFAIRTVLS